MNKITAGDRFGYLVVIKDSGRRQNKHTVYECLCDCGNTHYVKGIRLTQGSARSCGCKQYVKGRYHVISKPIIRQATLDSIGLTINRLTILDFKKETKKPLRVILRCSCGNVVERDYTEFKKGNIKSCGCLTLEIRANAVLKRIKEEQDRLAPKPPKKLPEYIPKQDMSNTTHGHLTVLYWCGIQITKSKSKLALWYCQCSCGNYVVKTTIALKNPNASCGCTLYEWRKNNAIKTANGKRDKIISFLKEEWTPRNDIDHKNRRFRSLTKNLLLIKQPNGCAICGYMGDNVNQLCAHHYKPHALFPKLRYMLCNLVILCRNCHDELHKTLGYNCISIPQQIAYIVRERQNKPVLDTLTQK